jgi:hypothetical protein
LKCLPIIVVVLGVTTARAAAEDRARVSATNFGTKYHSAVTVKPDRKARMDRMLFDQTMKTIQKGMTPEEVEGLLGPPDLVLPLRGGPGWQYRWPAPPGKELSQKIVIGFVGGKVAFLRGAR